MKAVLISIHPEWVAKISAGTKTGEVRKNFPKLKPPFKCYVYCTQPHTHDPHKVLEIHNLQGKILRGNGKVVGEFVCTGIHNVRYTMDGLADVVDCNTTCLNPKDFISYGKGHPLYSWRISNVKIYSTPLEVNQLLKEPFGEFVNRPPQSWCYVEEMEYEQLCKTLEG